MSIDVTTSSPVLVIVKSKIGMKKGELSSADQEKREESYGDFDDDEDYVGTCVREGRVCKLLPYAFSNRQHRVEMVDPKTKEYNPPRGVFKNAEPTRYGDWEQKVD